jgi:hypothetical protein
MEQSNDVSSLVILGNGFDLKCGLPSSFQQFFSSIDNNFSEIHNLFEDSFTKLSGNSVYLNNTSEGISFSEYNWFKIHKNTLIDPPDIENDWDASNLFSSDLKKFGFWTFCFVALCEDAQYWYDIEGFVNDFFTKRSNHYGKSMLTGENRTRFTAIIDYINDLKDENILSSFSSIEDTDLIIKKLTFLLLYVVGYNPDKDLSEFLLTQLKKFERIFDDYLTQQLDEKSYYYEIEAAEKLEELSNGETYNQLNFNYTRVKSKNMNIRRNIHSTLQHGPIIGIDSDKVFADSRIYKFTKTYRIMKLALGTDESELIPKSIHKIIFYGHSLAPADYSYFQSIFDKCNIYQNNIILVFYYSTYDGCNEEQATRIIFDRVSQLLDNYGKTIPNHGKNLLSKMLLENRIRIKEL